jgi:hypothetical protein
VLVAEADGTGEPEVEFEPSLPGGQGREGGDVSSGRSDAWVQSRDGVVKIDVLVVGDDGRGRTGAESSGFASAVLQYIARQGKMTHASVQV